MFSSQCVKRLWAYLKEKELQDPENKQWFTPDDTMSPIFGNEKIKCFSMSKYLKVLLLNFDWLPVKPISICLGTSHQPRQVEAV